MTSNSFFFLISCKTCTYITAEFWFQCPEECDLALNQFGDEPLFIPTGYKRESGHSLSSKPEQTKEQPGQWDPRKDTGENNLSKEKHVGLCVQLALL